jgi:hypothetical protein
MAWLAQSGKRTTMVGYEKKLATAQLDDRDSGSPGRDGLRHGSSTYRTLDREQRIAGRATQGQQRGILQSGDT